jgi:hypothetical protein
MDAEELTHAFRVALFIWLGQCGRDIAALCDYTHSRGIQFLDVFAFLGRSSLPLRPHTLVTFL